MCRGFKATSSPHRSPASIRVSTISRCWSGIAARRRVYSSGVRVRALRVMTLGSSVWSHGLWTRTRSLTARAKIEDSITWYLRIDRGDSPPSLAWATQSWTSDGEIRFSRRWPKNG